MSDDTERGWAEAAEVLDTRTDAYEEADNLSDDLPEGFRAVEVYDNGETRFRIERETQYEPYWVAIAEFTAGDADYEWAEEIADGTPDNIRGVVDYESRTVWLEARIGE